MPRSSTRHHPPGPERYDSLDDESSSSSESSRPRKITPLENEDSYSSESSCSDEMREDENEDAAEKGRVRWTMRSARKDKNNKKKGLASQQALPGTDDPKARIAVLSKRQWKLWAGYALLFLYGVVSTIMLLIQHAGSDDSIVGKVEHGDERALLSAAVGGLPQPRKVSGMGMFPEIDRLFEGNRNWTTFMDTNYPGVIEQQAEEGQKPPFLYIGCSDSRVSESQITSSLPGTLFVHRNVGNQYNPYGDLNAETVLSYAVEHLKVKHILVVGHVGCGAVQGAIATPAGAHAEEEGEEGEEPEEPEEPEEAEEGEEPEEPEEPEEEESAETEPGSYELGEERLAEWLKPIRKIFKRSTRPEIVALRNQYTGQAIPAPGIDDAAFIALVEENVKVGVIAVAADPVVQKSWVTYQNQQRFLTAHAEDHQLGNITLPHTTSPSDVATAAPSPHTKRTAHTENEAPIAVWAHGFVYDIRTGVLRDLGVSLGPGDGDWEHHR